MRAEIIIHISTLFMEESTIQVKEQISRAITNLADELVIVYDTRRLDRVNSNGNLFIEYDTSMVYTKIQEFETDIIESLEELVSLRRRYNITTMNRAIMNISHEAKLVGFEVRWRNTEDSLREDLTDGIGTYNRYNRLTVEDRYDNLRPFYIALQYDSNNIINRRGEDRLNSSIETETENNRADREILQNDSNNILNINQIPRILRDRRYRRYRSNKSNEEDSINSKTLNRINRYIEYSDDEEVIEELKLLRDRITQLIEGEYKGIEDMTEEEIKDLVQRSIKNAEDLIEEYL